MPVQPNSPWVAGYVVQVKLMSPFPEIPTVEGPGKL